MVKVFTIENMLPQAAQMICVLLKMSKGCVGNTLL